MNRVETSKHTHTELIHLLSFSLSIRRWYYSSPFIECAARHLSLNTSRHRAQSTALSIKGVDPCPCVIGSWAAAAAAQASLSYAGTYIQSFCISPFFFWLLFSWPLSAPGSYQLWASSITRPRSFFSYSNRSHHHHRPASQPAQKILRIARHIGGNDVCLFLLLLNEGVKKGNFFGPAIVSLCVFINAPIDFV